MSWPADIITRFAEIPVPARLLNGRYGECTPASAELFASRVRGAERVVSERSARMPITEESDAYIADISDFPGRSEAA